MDIRSFLAFELPPQMKETVSKVSSDLRRSNLDVRWVRPKGIHLTIVFLGDMRRQDLDAMGGPLEAACSRYAPLEVSLTGVGCFPNTRRPRVIWIGLQGDLERMGRLRDNIHKELRPFGIKEEGRSFAPHLTLGRFRNPGRPGGEVEGCMRDYALIGGPACTLSELILFKSDLKPTGAEYTKMASFPLVGTR